MVLCEYQSKIYDSLGKIEKITKLVTDDHIRGIGEIIIDHNYGNDVMVVLAHRHFNLADNEVMLEMAEGDIRVAKPILIQDLASFKAIPTLVACNGDDKKWHPVGYGVHDDGIMPAAWNDASFLDDVGKHLMKHNLLDKILLAAAHVDGKNHNDGAFYIEDNYGKSRRSELSLANEKDLSGAIKTTYFFNRGSGGIVFTICLSVCKPYDDNTHDRDHREEEDAMDNGKPFVSK